MLSFSQQVLVKRIDVLRCMQNILPTTATICFHMDIVHIQLLPEGMAKGTHYMWFHPQIRPWG